MRRVLHVYLCEQNKIMRPLAYTPYSEQMVNICFLHSLSIPGMVYHLVVSGMLHASVASNTC